MKITTLIVGIAFSFSTLSCKKVCKDDVLTIKRETFSSTDFRTDGYYYALTGYTYTKEAVYNIYIFYNNGILFNTSFSDLEYTEGAFQNSDWAHNKFGWGLFEKKSTSVFDVQYWIPSQCGLPVSTQTLNIINDTTFIESIANDTFHFKFFSPKPDSTNEFIK